MRLEQNKFFPIKEPVINFVKDYKVRLAYGVGVPIAVGLSVFLGTVVDTSIYAVKESFFQSSVNYPNLRPPVYNPVQR